MPNEPLVITFIKGDKLGSETDYRDLLPINMSGVIRPDFGVKGYMLETPGLTSFGSGSGIDRGGIWNERLKGHYRVSGNKFIEVNSAGASTELGDILGSDTASLPYSFETQGIIANGQFFLYDPTNGFRQVTDINVSTPIDGVWIDGFYCLTDGESLYHTEIIAGTPVEDSINPLSVATAEFSPDPVVGVGKTADDKWIVFNRYTIEFFENVGGETFAFSRLQTRALKVGLVATHAKAESGGTWYFVGGPKEASVSVFMLQGGGIAKIASREVEKLLKQYSEDEMSEIVLEIRERDGYTYLLLRLPSDTLMLNINLMQSDGPEMAWSLLTTGLNQQPWRGIHGIFEPRLGEWVYGDKLDNSLGLLDETSAEQYGEIQEWYLNTPFIYIEHMSIDELEIETIPGFTTTDDATVFLSFTYDGVSYGTEVPIEYGKPSVYGQRFIARRLGYVRDWFSLRLRGASRSRMAFSRAFINYG